MKTIIKNVFSILLILTLLILISCEKYLDNKPNMSLSTPSTPKDLQAILDMVSFINDGNPGILEIAADNFFLPKQSWEALPEIEQREAYVWGKTPISEYYYSVLYKKVYTANIVFDFIDEITFKDDNLRMDILGQAYFVRGLAYFKILEILTKPYNMATSNIDLGIVLRNNSNINTKSMRSTIEESYIQIQHDLQMAVLNLSVNSSEFVTRPSKAAAYGVLSRLYMNKREYEKASAYADSSLALKSSLIDYNQILSNNAYPFERYNNEVIYHSRFLGVGDAISESVARVDTTLYASYKEGDIRKRIFFTKQSDSFYAFTGDYSKSSVERFDGITTAEMLLNRAECNARNGKLGMAIQDMNNFISKRYVTPKNYEGYSQDELINSILEERRKELVCRALRWSDIRRLSFENNRAIILKRQIGEITYELSPSQIQEFSYLFPTSVIELGGVIQN